MKRTLTGLIPVYALVFLLVLMVSMFTDTAVSMISTEILQHPCIVIDAGHGGVDGGATSCTGMLESGINLQIALRLNDLMNLLGYRTRMIRMTDISVYKTGETIIQKKVSDLKTRAEMVNTTQNGILISIHQNHFADSQYRGAQVFYAMTEGSELLAKALQENIRATINPGSNRQAKRASSVFLMENIQCPGILIECGFLSNPQEEALLRSEIYQKKLCCVIAASVADFCLDR